ncbi:MAG TPA: GH1 family beta-glucosidase [Solirubrobacteraceae bacterium]|nr:GH1 family beta-glucosidase [Solirubrobacteraceae bacterium]
MTATEADRSAAPARAFPAGFLWGAATASYQIEGAAREDGRGPSIWDTFSHTPGRVRGGDTGDIACDFYHRFESDLDLLATLGLNAFRFSVAWPRVQPTGRGAVNQPGLDFYRALLDGLRAREILPAITLYHWDLPQPLEDAGGWASRETALRFAEYAQIVAAALDDEDAIWITVNEPQVVANQGYRIGIHAPGKNDDALAAAATHHLLLGHGLALARLRDALPGARVGVTLDIHPVRALSEEASEAAAVTDAEQNRIFVDPVLHGSYPAKARAHLLPPAELVRDGDMEVIGAPIDFLGVNYYSPHYVRLDDGNGLGPEEAEIPGRPGVVVCKPERLPRTSMGWLIEPDGLYDTLQALTAETSPQFPLYITENGCAAEDYVNPDGVVDDFERVEYLRGHLDAAWRALRDGVNLAGYFHWSLLDNFEWAWGYQKRFGLVFVDFATQRRIPKRSAEVYGEVARRNELGAELS